MARGKREQQNKLLGQYPGQTTGCVSRCVMGTNLANDESAASVHPLLQGLADERRGRVCTMLNFLDGRRDFWGKTLANGPPSTGKGTSSGEMQTPLRVWSLKKHDPPWSARVQAEPLQGIIGAAPSPHTATKNLSTGEKGEKKNICVKKRRQDDMHLPIFRSR